MPIEKGKVCTFRLLTVLDSGLGTRLSPLGGVVWGRLTSARLAFIVWACACGAQCLGRGLLLSRDISEGIITPMPWLRFSC